MDIETGLFAYNIASSLFTLNHNSPIMRVALVTHNVYIGDGQGRVNFELSRYLLKQGISVDLIADSIDRRLEDWGAKWIPLHPELPGVPLDPDRLLLAKVWRFHRQANQLLEEIGHRYDIIMGCGHTLSVPHTVNVVHFVHGAWLNSSYHPSKHSMSLDAAYQWLFNHLNARWELHSLHQAQRIIAVSEKIKQELIYAGIPPERIETVVNGVDIGEFYPEPTRRAPLGLPIDVPLAFFAGDIRSNRKNLDTVLQALTQVPELHLAVAGSLSGSPYPKMASDLGVERRVHFLGFRKDIPALMRAADIFAFPSRYEACTLVLLEALASGLPVITARTTGGAELVTDRCGVVLDDPNDTAALASALKRIVHDPAMLHSMRDAARRTAEQHSWQRMAEQYLETFHEMMRQPKLGD